MKKLMMILASVSLSSPIVGTAISCHSPKTGGEINTTGIPTVGTIKANLKKAGLDVDNLDVDLAPGMKTAIIRFMPDVPNRPFLTKKVDLKWTTNDISKIITVTSLPYDNGSGKKLTVDEVLTVVNSLNGTNFTFSDIEINLDQEISQWVITPKPGGNFTGSAVEIVNEPITFSQAFPLKNIGNIYIADEVWADYKKDPEGRTMNMAAAIMEFVGDRNRFASLYKDAMLKAMMGALDGGVEISINQDNGEGTLKITTEVEHVINHSTLTANFTVNTTPRKFLTQDNVKQTEKLIPVKLDKIYTKETENELRYDLVTKLLGKQFADQYQEIWYNEIWLTFNEDGKGATIEAKPGSKILAASDTLASLMTKIPAYKLNVTFE
ncbi:hypothetical protein [Spiroplasma phoeniceum]|uniref:Lipoprotein n=1 Tax=Spiroplasma phoeniceum P40 TaxID=1276259 RepID=A0A345DRA7_9MOLU|nr:hypothetical protein [Spiroplasma phoeniceum]AXF96748.1 putative lipoprotein [Spiroplasma phoeniceum P40]